VAHYASAFVLGRVTLIRTTQRGSALGAASMPATEQLPADRTEVHLLSGEELRSGVKVLRTEGREL
jgi:hypothetical protein